MALIARGFFLRAGNVFARASCRFPVTLGKACSKTRCQQQLQAVGHRGLAITWTRRSGQDKEEDMDDLKQNPYYGKYADKIAKMQK